MRLLVQRSVAGVSRLAGCLAALTIGVCVERGVAAEVRDVPLSPDAVRCPALPSVAQVLADDEKLRDTHGFEEERVLRDFALFWYRNLATDLVDGNGPALDVLAEAFRPACPQREALLVWLRRLLLASATGTDFSRRLAMARAQAVSRMQWELVQVFRETCTRPGVFPGNLYPSRSFSMVQRVQSFDVAGFGSDVAARVDSQIVRARAV